MEIYVIREQRWILKYDMRKMCNTVTYFLNTDLTQRISEPTITFKNKLIKSIL